MSFFVFSDILNFHNLTVAADPWRVPGQGCVDNIGCGRPWLLTEGRCEQWRNYKLGGPSSWPASLSLTLSLSSVLALGGRKNFSTLGLSINDVTITSRSEGGRGVWRNVTVRDITISFIITYLSRRRDEGEGEVWPDLRDVIYRDKPLSPLDRHFIRGGEPHYIRQLWRFGGPVAPWVILKRTLGLGPYFWNFVIQNEHFRFGYEWDWYIGP